MRPHEGLEGRKDHQLPEEHRGVEIAPCRPMIRMVRLSSTKKSNGTVSPPARHGVAESPARRPLRFDQAHGLWQDRRAMAGAALR